MTRTRPVSAVLLVLALLAAAAARAETQEDRDKALALVREGNQFLDAGNAAEALARFRRAFSIVESPKLHFNFGQALAELPGREADAHEAFVQYLDQVPTADPVKRAEANRQVLALRKKLAFLAIRTSPEGVAILLDGSPRGATPLVKPLAASAGAHRLRLSKPGLTTISEVITVTAGQEVSRDYVLRSAVVPAAVSTISPTVSPPPPTHPVEPAAVAMPGSRQPTAVSVAVTPKLLPDVGRLETSPVQLETPTSTEPHSGARLAGMIVAGTGVVLGTVGFFVYRSGVAKRDNIMGAAQYDESDGNFRTLGDAGIALMAVGGAAVATGTVLYLLNMKSRPESQAKESVWASVSLGYLPRAATTVEVSGRF